MYLLALPKTNDRVISEIRSFIVTSLNIPSSNSTDLVVSRGFTNDIIYKYGVCSPKRTKTPLVDFSPKKPKPV